MLWALIGAVYDSTDWAILNNRQSDLLLSPSCYLQIVNFDKYTELHHVIIDIISSAIMLWTIQLNVNL